MYCFTACVHLTLRASLFMSRLTDSHVITEHLSLNLGDIVDFSVRHKMHVFFKIFGLSVTCYVSY